MPCPLCDPEFLALLLRIRMTWRSAHRGDAKSGEGTKVFAVDTNVLLRLFIFDEPTHAAKAQHFFVSGANELSGP